MRVTAIIPARDEEACIGAVVAAVRAVAGGPVIVVDNGSSDGTAVAARAAGAEVVAEPVAGYGRACMAGVRAAGEVDVLLFLDGDGSDRAEDIAGLLAAIEAGADLALAVRRGAGVEAGAITPAAKVGNWLSGGLIGLLWGRRLHDLSPLKAVRREALLSLGAGEQTYGWTVELLARSAARGLTIVECSAGYRRRAGGTSKVSGNLRASAVAGYRILRTIAVVARTEGIRGPGASRRRGIDRARRT